MYRTLTGEAIKLLKEGMEAAVITEALKRKYITPLLDSPKKKSESILDKESEASELVKGMRDFTSFPQTPSRFKKITRTRRSFLLQQITDGHSAAEYFSPTMQILRFKPIEIFQNIRRANRNRLSHDPKPQTD